MQRIWRWIWDDDNLWAVLALGLAVYGFASTILSGRWTIGYSLHPILLLALLGTVFGVAQLLRQRWARWVGLAWLGTLVFMSISLLVVLQFSWRGLIGVALLAVGVYFFWQHFFHRRPSAESDDEQPFLSLVLLFRELPYLDAHILTSLAEKAWGTEFAAPSRDDAGAGDDDDDGPEAFIVGEPPLFAGKNSDAFFLVYAYDRPYFDDPADVAEELGELRMRSAVLDHRAWVAVDIVSWFGENGDVGGAYRMIARLLAELADDQVLAVVDPDAQQLFVYDPETERKLRSDDPCAELREPYYAPIVQIADDDPAMLAAVAAARERFPEFVAAFESRDQERNQTFSVKAPFGEGDDVEYMWIEVSGIENDVVYGRLGNDPMHGPLRLGDRVRTSVSQINDWVYVRDDDFVGGFTVKLLTGRAKRPDAGA